MKKGKFSFFNTKRLSLFLGLVIALIVLGSTSLQYQLVPGSHETASTVNEEDPESSGTAAQVSSFTAVAQIVHVQLAIPLLLYFGEIHEVDDQVSQPAWLTSDHYSQFLKTLFRRIISPNAP